MSNDAVQKLNPDRGSWSAVHVAGKRCDVFEPSAPSPHGYVVVYLHDADSGRLVNKPAFTDQLQRHGLRVIAPQTGLSWWTDRVFPPFDEHMTAERFVLDAVRLEIRERFGAAPPRVALLGIGMGGQGALRLAFKHPNTFPIVAAISPSIDYQVLHGEGDEALRQMYSDAESARQDTATLHVHPLNWPRNVWFCCDPRDRWHESADRLRMKLAALGVPHECDLETSGGGRSLDYFDQMASRAIEFIVERLERERRRI